MASWIMIGVALLVAIITFQPRLLRSDAWRATVTPLASIIGSGFLVAGPILGSAAGRLAPIAMAGLCGIAWLFGSAIRHNIAVVEPLLDPDADKDWSDRTGPGWLPIVERISDLALAFAYFISVAYYLNLFAAFGLRTVHIEDSRNIALLSCGVIALLGTIGVARGLRWLENIELPAVGLKLALIAGLIAALGWTLGSALAAGQSDIIPRLDHPRGLHELSILMGLVILVQGFETSRYLGHSYSIAMRIRTMRRAQMLATLIYIVFIALMLPWFTDGLSDGPISETAIIDLLMPMGWAVVPLVSLTALASQLSAAVADMNGAGGLIHTATEGKLSVRIAYATVAIVAIGITLSANLFQIIVYASKAFVLYYGLQAGTATILCLRPGQRRLGLALVYGAGVILAILVILFGVPAE